ncbi:MAG: hypothetical protein H8D56_07085 [Planctomycetes bacterium]|nr:hypothetical protein [Planctomycetota bacterium]MBL7154785.1 hypothetical protein [Phycisphaerae bacterium]
METELKKLKKVSVLVCCVSLLLVGLASASAAEKEGSVLERVKAIKDPELAQLLQVALENLSEDAAITRPELVRRVTEAYAQIRLLDIQIADIDKKIEFSKTSEVVRENLMLTRAKLEAERMTQLAKLREAMYVEPRYAFGRIPIDKLNSWLDLQLDGRIVGVIEYSRPYYEDIRRNKTSTRRTFWFGQKPEQIAETIPQTIAWLKTLITQITDKGQLPLRIDIFRNVGGIKRSKEMYSQVKQLVKDAKLEMEVDVRLNKDFRPNTRSWNLSLSQGNVYIDGEPTARDVEGAVAYLMHYLSQLNTVLWPYEFHITVLDQESKPLVKDLKDALQEAAKEAGVEELLEIEQEESISPLNGWLALDVMGDSVRVSKCSKPYYQEPHVKAYHPVKQMMSGPEAIEYVKDFVKTGSNLPLRVDIHRNTAGSKPSEDLCNQLKKMVIDANLENEVNVNLGDIRRNVRDNTWILKQGKFYYDYGPGNVLGGEDWIFTHMRSCVLTRPGQLPMKAHIEFDAESKEAATNIVEDIQKLAKEFGVEHLLEVELKEMEPK